MEFLKILEILLRRKRIFFSVFLIFLVAVVAATHLVTPTYKAKAKLLIGSTDVLSSFMLSLGIQGIGKSTTADAGDSGAEYQTDATLVTIRPLLEKLISSLELKAQNGELLEPEKLVKWTFVQLILPRPYVEVEQYESADILEIVSASTDPSEAANMCNELAELYIHDMLARRQKEYEIARLFVGSRIHKVQQDYYRVLSELEDYMVSEGTVDLDLETSKLIDKISALEDTYEDNVKRILESEREIAEIKEQLKDREKLRKESEIFVQSEQVNELKTKLNSLLVTISERRLAITEEHPDYKQLEKEIETVKELIQDESAVVFDNERFAVDPIYDELLRRMIDDIILIETASAKKEFLAACIKKYQNDLLQIPRLFVKSTKVELALSINKELYRSLLEYLTQIGIAESLTLSNIKLVEPATEPRKPHFPNRPLNYALGMFLGVFWALALTFFVEYIDHTIKSPEDLRVFKGLALLGTLPRSRDLGNNKIISALNPDSPVVEAYRMIKHSIRYATADNPVKVIAVTSSIHSEGKSSMASNIAITFNVKGGRVVLLDLNLRRPTLHKFFDIPNDAGITTMLTQGSRLEEAIVHTDIEGLDLLPSGPVPDDPGELIESQQLKEIVATLRKTYDLVIIDTPPVLQVSDPVMAGKTADCILYIIESGRVTCPLVESAKDRFEQADLKIIGVVLNKFVDNNLRYHFFGNLKE